jgi:hypothetical protein
MTVDMTKVIIMAFGVENLAISKNSIVNRKMVPHWNAYKYTWASPDWKAHNQADHMLMDRRWHSHVPDV